jgi:hypothetical protein
MQVKENVLESDRKHTMLKSSQKIRLRGRGKGPARCCREVRDIGQVAGRI